VATQRAAGAAGGQQQVDLEPGCEIGELAGHLLGHGLRERHISVDLVDPQHALLLVGGGVDLATRPSPYRIGIAQ